MSEEVKNMNETNPETVTEETAAPVETMADYEDAINASLKPIHEGDILTGEVNPSGHTVDIWPSDFTKDPTFTNFSDMSQNVDEEGNRMVSNTESAENSAPC